jgi:hypothetical protein
LALFIVTHTGLICVKTLELNILIVGSFNHEGTAPLTAHQGLILKVQKPAKVFYLDLEQFMYQRLFKNFAKIFATIKRSNSSTA